MKAFILAAGRGERMRPLTDRVPKPLLEVGGQPLIVHTLLRLKQAGIEDLVINLSWLGNQIEQALGTGNRFGVNIEYSREPEALETAGGIVQALPLLGSTPFLVVNGDVWTDYDFSRLAVRPSPGMLGHLVVVENPDHHPAGDFGLENGRLTLARDQKYTYSGIGVYSPEIFAGLAPGKQPLAPLLRQAISNSRLEGELYLGQWRDVGSPERLRQLDRDLRHNGSGP